MAKPFSKHVRSYIIRKAKKVETKNITFLLYAPALGLAFIWGLCPGVYNLLHYFQTRPVWPKAWRGIQPHYFGHADAEFWKVLLFWFIVLVGPICVTLGIIPLFCKAIQVLLPKEFDDATIDEELTK